MTEILSTGIEVLDRKLDGGIPRGQVVALTASPASQSELFLYEMARVRRTHYLTTERTVDDIEDSFVQVGASLDDVTIHGLSADNPVTEATESLEGLSSESTVIIDPMRCLEETGTDDYRDFMNELKRRTAETGGLSILHCLDGRQVPLERDRTEYLADIIFHLSTDLRGGSVENTLSIPKFRGGQSLPEAIDLDLTADVTIDVSRKIA